MYNVRVQKDSKKMWGGEKSQASKITFRVTEKSIWIFCCLCSDTGF